MSNYTVEFQPHDIPFSRETFRVRHIRYPDGRNVLPQGGITILVDSLGRVFEARCRADENFCKKSGILVALQKYVDLVYPGYHLFTAKPANPGLTVELSKEPSVARFWWL